MQERRNNQLSDFSECRISARKHRTRVYTAASNVRWRSRKALSLYRCSLAGLCTIYRRTLSSSARVGVRLVSAHRPRSKHFQFLLARALSVDNANSRTSCGKARCVHPTTVLKTCVYTRQRDLFVKKSQERLRHELSERRMRPTFRHGTYHPIEKPMRA